MPAPSSFRSSSFLSPLRETCPEHIENPLLQQHVQIPVLLHGWPRLPKQFNWPAARSKADFGTGDSLNYTGYSAEALPVPKITPGLSGKPP